MKRIFAIILVLAALLSITACGAKQEEPSLSTEVSSSDPQLFPVTVTDQAKRTVTIDKQPQKIVSGYYISTSLLIALGIDDKLVGIEAKADKRSIYKLSAPELINLPSVGTAKEFDLEGCAALKPDLVILPIKLKKAASALEDLGIKVIYVNPENANLLNEAIDLVAAATGTQAQADKLKTFTETQKTLLCDKLSEVSKPSVYIGGNSSFLSTAGSKMYQNELIELAGGINVASAIEDSYWAEVSYEQILTWDPEFIIIASDASYTENDILSDPNLAGCRAIANGNVYKLPDLAEAWDSPVPSCILGSVWLASRLHSDVLSKDECSKIIEEYYTTFYQFSYNESEN